MPTRILSWQQLVTEADPDYQRKSLQPWTYEFSNGRLFLDPINLYGTATQTATQTQTSTSTSTTTQAPTQAFISGVNGTGVANNFKNRLGITGVNGTGFAGTVGITAGAPSQAAAAGFHTLAFFSDFISTSEVATSTSPSSGKKWYWGDIVVGETMSTSDFSVNTTATAASISNGNTGGGSNASASGGILTINSSVNTRAAMITIPGWTLNTGSDTLPTLGNGCWQHAYFEVYIQTKTTIGSTNVNNGWPAFWLWGAQSLSNYGFGNSSLNATHVAEVDIWETFGTLFTETPGDWQSSMHDWLFDSSGNLITENTVGGNSTTTIDDNWHTYGCLWVSTGAGTGQVQFYLDNVLQNINGSTTFTTGSASPGGQVILEQDYMFMILDTGLNWAMNVDWVKVWTA